jgi:hypothetical protein
MAGFGRRIQAHSRVVRDDKRLNGRSLDRNDHHVAGCNDDNETCSLDPFLDHDCLPPNSNALQELRRPIIVPRNSHKCGSPALFMKFD